ncbi:F-actin-monooxygenase MICAL2-like isoform X3 [Erpetoichthys calabaricus]|uniref:F-actin-monooxygenase MICAL2-like isoform X3 n=1 Tax=Erpetoichthys calabaricus TaxID=27687 RepID=UPI002233E6A3|nr:F-actin-monooxygenase MICAL2-like isoform X3 [Erpetoichthys calabaricus]
MGENDEEKNNQAGQLFENFVQASTCKGTIQAFNILCRQLELSPEDYRNFFKTLKSKVTSWKAKALWSKLEKRASHKAYKDVCRNTKCLIIGGGPCGLRTAIELAFLGAKVVVLEKRDTFSRNNVLHLWPYTIHDLRGLGAKKFYGKFCAGSIDHISIRQLQLILVKVALILGVEFHVNVEFIKLLEPSHDNQGMGWRAEVCPADHPVASFDFDVIVGADGRRNTLEGFRRKEFRGKLAIAITANFINRNTTAEAKVEEISGVAFIFNQKFFQDLKEETGIDLENIVYYKDNTHYFVMTAKKQSLLDKGVIIYDYTDTEMLLSNENVNQEALLSYAREAADFATNYQLPSLDFAMNHCGQPDVAMFDFTCMYASENAALIRERRGQKLLVALVGDSLLEPFWPMGTGCARGFLAAFDTVWMVRSWALGRAPLEILAERESIYRLLPQTTPENITKNFDQYTIDPATRYPNLNSNCLQPFQIRHLYITSELKPCTVERAPSLRQSVNLSRRESEIRPNRLLTWCQKTTEGYRNVDVCNLTTSWKSGLALCAVIHHFRPDLIDFDSLDVEESTKNIQLAFDIAEQEFGISPVITAKEVAAEGEPDKLGMVLYLSKFYELFKGTQLISSGHKRGSGESNDVYLAKSSRKAHNINYTLPRKRTPKDEKKSEEDDATNKRRRRSFNYLEETSNISNWSTTSASECGEGRDSLNQNKVKSMASQLLAKFEENAPSTSLRRQTDAGFSEVKPARPPSLDLSENPRFAKPKDNTTPSSATPQKRQYQSSSSSQYLANCSSKSFQCAEFIQQKPKQVNTEVQVKCTEPSTSCRSTVLAVSGMLQRLQHLEDKIAQRRAQSLSAREFNKKSIKEKAAHLCSLFDYMAFRPQSTMPAPSLPHPRPKTTPAFPSIASSSSSYPSHVTSRPPLTSPQELDKLPHKKVMPTEHMNYGSVMTVGKVSAVIGAMAEVLVTLYENDHKPKSCSTTPLLGSLRKEFPQNLGGSDTCHFCKKRVYVMERLSAEGCFFHRECFRCDFCKSSLRLSNCAFDVDEGKFYCKPHYTQRKSSKYRKRHSEFPKEETDLSKQMEAAPSSPEAIKAYSAVSSLEGRPPGDYVQSLAGHIFPSDYANGHIFEDTYASFPTHPSTVKVVLEEDQILHSLVAERIMVISDASCSDTESDPFGSSFNGDYREEMTEENTQEDVVQRPDSDVPHSPNPTTTEEVILPPKASSSITLSPVTRWRKRIRNTLPIMMYKKKDQLVEDPPEDLQPSQSSPHQNPSQLVASPPLTPKSGGVHIYDLTPESDLPTSATQVLDSAKLFPSSDSLQTVVASGTYSDNENGQEDIDDTMNKSPKRKLVLPPNVKASLLDWELLATEDSKERGRHAQNERTKTEHCDAQKNDLGSSGSDSTASLPHSYHSHPEMQENSNCSSNLDPTPSPFHFLINAFRKTLNASKKMFSLDASEKTDSVTHSHSDGGLNSSKGKEDSKTEQLLKNSCTLSSQLHLNNQPETMTPIPKPVVVSNFHRDTHSELNVAQGKNTISPFSLQIDTEEKDDVDVSKNTKLKEDMSVLFKKVSLTGGSSRYSRNDLSFSQQKRLNEFSALQVNEPQDMKKNAKGKNSLWNLFSNVRKKTTEKKAPVRSRPWSSAHPEYSQQMSGINQQLAGDQMNLQETSSSSDDTQEKASSKLKASSSWRRKTRLEKSNRQQLRREELKRLHKAQIIQRQLQEVEERQRDLEERGVKLEKLLRGESDHKGNDETHLLHTWFKLVLEKNRLTRYESELMIFAQELELEDRQSRLQQILRERMSTDDSEKTKQDCAEEEKILNQILAVVEERNDLVGILDEQRLLEKAEDEDLECILLTRGYQFNWS